MLLLLFGSLALRRDNRPRFAGFREDWIAGVKGLPTLDDDVDVSRVELDQPGSPAGPLRRDHCGARTAKRIEHDVPAL